MDQQPPVEQGRPATPSPQAQSRAAPPGWYPNPDPGGLGQRYWNGHEWTPHYHGQGQAVLAGMGWTNLSGWVWVGAAGLVLMVVGSFGPWVTALGVFSANGTKADGTIVLGAAAVAALLLISYARRRPGARAFTELPVIAALAGAAGAAVTIYDLNRIASHNTLSIFGRQLDVIDPGWGIYAALIGSLAVALSGAALAVTARSTDIQR